jgi:hypothetical protein
MAAAPRMKNVLSAVLHQLHHGEASSLIDGDDAREAEALGPYEPETVGRMESDARRDLEWCRREIETVLKSIS